MSHLSTGKIPIRVLNDTVLRMTGAPSKSVATPPLAGLDFAAVKHGNGFMIISADPVTGVERDIGEYAVRISSNDVATSGSRPRFLESVILLPEGASTSMLREIGGQIDRTAKELGLAVVGGHTEVTPGLRKPIVVVTSIAFTRRYASSRDAKPGDSIMMTKTAGLEGTAALASLYPADARLDHDTLARARQFVKKFSVVDEAVAAFRTGHVRAMHDCTEGGLLGAAFEMSVASGVGFELHESSVPLAPETKAICATFSVDPLRLIGSGSLLMAVREGSEEKVASALKGICRTAVVGRFIRKGRVLFRADGKRVHVKEAPEDELWRMLPALGRD